MQFPTNSKLEAIINKSDCRSALVNSFLDTTEEQPYLVATNGHALVALPVTAATEEQGYVSPTALKAARKLAKKNDTSDITCNGQLGLSDGTLLPRPSNEECGRFPAWRQVMPAVDRPAMIRLGINAALLLQVAEALGQESVILEIAADNGALAPITVLPIVKTDARRGVIMPIRVQ